MPVTFSYRPSLSAFAATMILSACAGQQMGTAVGAIPQGLTSVATSAHGVAHKATSSNDLIYAVSPNVGYVLSYPQGALLGSFNPPTASHFLSACSDRNGDVFATVREGGVVEYTHGGTTAVETLNFDGEPGTCSVDPTTGNLAVSNDLAGYGDVGIYQGGQGEATYYTANLEIYSACAYDDAGNLFVEGTTSTADHVYLALTELPEGSGTFRALSLGKAPVKGRRPGGIEWEGSYLAMGVSKPPNHPQEIWHVKVSGSGGTIIGKTKAKGIYHWLIQGNTLISPYKPDYENVAYWNYPKGGKPTGVINDGLAGLSALTVSVGSSR